MKATRAFGLRMEKFTLAHMSMLNALKSPLLLCSRDANAIDILLATVICAHRKFPRWDNWWFKFKLRLWVKRAARFDAANGTRELQLHIFNGLQALKIAVDAKLAELEAK